MGTLPGSERLRREGHLGAGPEAENDSRGKFMNGHQCSCGLAFSATGELTDHLLEVFTPHDDIGHHGKTHVEWSPNLACSCGFIAANPAELDEHFLAVFSPPDAVGRDGARHARRSSGG
jgi:hypothetical protein